MLVIASCFTEGRVLLAVAEACSAWLDCGERCLLALPMFHIFGVGITLAAPLMKGALLIMWDFQPAAVVRALRERGITAAPMVPVMIQACLNQPDSASGEYRSLRRIIYGASPISEGTLRRAMDVFQCEFVQAYGMTEVAPVTVLSPKDHRRALSDEPGLLLSAGTVWPGLELQIVDLHDQPVPPGTVGEILARGATLMNGYWRRPEATAEVLRGGWMHTGDMGYMDADGYLYVQDRLKDMIVSGAENIYPCEVEAVLSAMPAVASVAVIGVPDARWGESVKAIVVLREGERTTEREIVDFCRGKLGTYKLPRSVDFVDQLPYTATGKVSKRQLREPYWRGYARRVAGA